MFRTKSSSRETKSGISASAARQKRLVQSNSLRRNDREELLSMRRRDNSMNQGDPSLPPALSDSEILKDLPHLPILVQNLRDSDPQVVQDSVSRLRQLVSLHENPPFDPIIQLGGLSSLVDLLTSKDSSIIFEAAWCLTNIASGTFHQTAAVVHAGAIPHLVQLLDSSDVKIRDQCVWALGNIAGEGSEYRDMILNLGGLDKLITISQQILRLCMLRNVSWAISNLCRGKDPAPDFRIVSRVLPVLANMLNFENDDEVVVDAAWSISFLSNDPETKRPEEEDIDRIQCIIDCGIVYRLVQLLTHPNVNIKTPVLRTIGNIVSGTHTQTQVVINNNAVPGLLSLMSSNRKSFRREAAWALSNMAAGTHHQLQYLKDCNTFGILLQSIQTQTTTLAIKREICWTICNAVCLRYPDIVPHILALNWIPMLLSLLNEPDSEVQLCVIDTLRHMLEFGDGNKETINISGAIREVNVYAMAVEEANGVQALEQCLSATAFDVYNSALELLTKYLGCDIDASVDPSQETFEVTDSNSNTYVTSNPFHTTDTFAIQNKENDETGDFEF